MKALYLYFFMALIKTNAVLRQYRVSVICAKVQKMQYLQGLGGSQKLHKSLHKQSLVQKGYWQTRKTLLYLHL